MVKNKVAIILAVILIMGVVAISGCTGSGSSSGTDSDSDNNTQYEEKLIQLKENPKDYVGKNVTIVGDRGFSSKHEENSALGSPEGTEIMMGDSDKVGSSSVSIWYTGEPIDLDLGGKIKVSGIFVRNSNYKYGLADYVIKTDKIEVIN
ncbi:MAG: hypothetical protein Q8M06_09080 [Methanobacteriaceae archaeon]|jgi:hypothetical protein|nr:hypothetical protein [Methanobacteriaceae archaeon]